MSTIQDHTDRPNTRAPRGDSPGRVALRHFRRNRLAVVGLTILILLVVAVVFGPPLYRLFGGPGPYEIACGSFEPGSGAHPLGCDSLGRDLLARLLDGGRISLTVGITVAVGTTLLGVIVGALAGYAGGAVDSVLMRFTDTVMALPSLFLILAAAAVLGPSLTNTVLVLCLIEWTSAARLVRGEFLTLRQRDYVTAARAQGLTPLRIMRHIGLNVVPTIAVSATLTVAMAILAESGLSFLGMGTQPPAASWGYMLSDAQTYMFTHPELAVWPGVLVMLTVLSVNFVGDGLRQALDPRRRAR